MAETTARQFIISTLILGAIIAGAFSLISLAMPEDTSQFITSNATLNKFNTLRSNADKIKAPLEGAEPKKGIEGVLSGLIEVSWGALKSVWTSFGTMSSLLNDLAQGSLGIAIPVWFTGMIASIIGIIIAFSLMAAWFKWHI